MPESIDVRLVESINDEPGQRTEKLTIATALLDHKLYDALWLAGVYRGRWRVETRFVTPKKRDFLSARAPKTGFIWWLGSISTAARRSRPASQPRKLAGRPSLF